MSDPELTPRDKKLIRKANNDAGRIMFWLLIIAVTVVTPIEIRKFYQICQDPASQLRDYFHPWLIISLHIILLRRIMLYRRCLRVIKKVHDKLPKSLLEEDNIASDAVADGQKSTDPA